MAEESRVNPSTGNFDLIGLTSSVADGLYIRKDGTSVTTASIPFAIGIKITAGQKLVFDGG